MRHFGNNTNFQRFLKLVFTSFPTKNIMGTIEEGVLNALVCSALNLKKLEICHFGNKPFNYSRLEEEIPRSTHIAARRFALGTCPSSHYD